MWQVRSSAREAAGGAGGGGRRVWRGHPRARGVRRLSQRLCVHLGGFELHHHTRVTGLPQSRHRHNLSVNLNDKAGSFYNHLSNGHHVTFYSDAGCTGFRIHREDNGSGGPHGPGVHDAFIYYERDDTSSIYFNTG